MSFKLAAVQMTSQDDVKKNIKRATELLLIGVDSGAKFLSLPENFSFMGKEEEKLKIAENIIDGESINFLRDFSMRHKVWLHGGSIPIIAGDNKVYNSSLLVNDKGEIAARYDKIHLFDVNLEGNESYHESGFVKRGDTTVTCKTPFCIVGLSICYDLRFPELYREITGNGAKVIFVPAAFTVKTGKAHWEVLLRARAIENQCYIVASAQCGTHPVERRTYGNSMIIDPWGTVTARAGDEETVISADVDLDYQDEVRKSIPCLDHKRLIRLDSFDN